MRLARNERFLMTLSRVGNVTSTKTMAWLDCDSSSNKGSKKTVERLKCKVCVMYKAKLASSKYFSDKWIVGAGSVRTSNVRDHARSEQHIQAMHLLRAEQAKADGKSLSDYAPIVKSMHSLSDDDRKSLQFKFDIAYFTAIEKLP